MLSLTGIIETRAEWKMLDAFSTNIPRLYTHNKQPKYPNQRHQEHTRYTHREHQNTLLGTIQYNNLFPLLISNQSTFSL